LKSKLSSRDLEIARLKYSAREEAPLQQPANNEVKHLQADEIARLQNLLHTRELEKTRLVNENNKPD